MVPEKIYLLLPHRLQNPGNQRDQQQAEAERKDVGVRQYRRDHEMTPSYRHPVVKDHRHGVLEHGERQRAEEHHRREQYPADDLTVDEKAGQLADDRT